MTMTGYDVVSIIRTVAPAIKSRETHNGNRLPLIIAPNQAIGGDETINPPA